MSGSSRSAARSACLNERVWTPDLPLRHQALLALVHELDRILDRDDVVGAGPVDQVHQRGQRGALARAGGPGDDDEPLGEVAEVLDLAADPHLVGRPNGRRDDAEDGHRAVPVAARVAAEAGEPLDLVGPVGVAGLAELADLPRRHDADEHRVEPLAGDRRPVLARQLAVVAKQRRLAAAEVEVRGAGVDQQAEQLLHDLPRLGQLGRAASAQRPGLGRGAAARSRRPHHDGRAAGTRGQGHGHLPAGRAVGKGQRLRPAEPGSGVGVGDLAHEGEDLRVGQRVLGERAGGAVRHQRGGLAHDQLERVGALLVQHLDQAIEPGHRQSQSRGRASRTRDLLTYQLTSSVSMAKKMPAPLR